MKKKILKKIGKISFIEKSWTFREELGSYICEGKVKNTGAAEQINIYIIGAICRKNENKPVKILTNSFKFERLANYYYIGDLQTNAEKEFILYINLPDLKEILINKNFVKNIKNSIDEGHLVLKLFQFYSTDFSDSSIRKMRKTRDSLSVVSDEEGFKKIDVINEEWNVDENKNTITTKGTLRNTGSLPLEDVFVISLLMDKESKKPISWEHNLKTHKAMSILKIDYLKVGAEKQFNNIIKLPKKIRSNNRKIDISELRNNIEKNEIIRKVELVYERSTVDIECIKRLNLGNSYFRIGNYDEAIKEYEDGIGLNKDDYRFYFNLGLAHYKTGRFKEALDYFHYLQKKITGLPKVNYFIGLLQFKFQNFDEALTEFIKLLKDNPNDSKSAYNIACIYFAKNNLNEGFSWLEKSIKIDEEYIRATARKDSQLSHLKQDERFVNLIYNF